MGMFGIVVAFGAGAERREEIEPCERGITIEPMPVEKGNLEEEGGMRGGEGEGKELGGKMGELTAMGREKRSGGGNREEVGGCDCVGAWGHYCCKHEWDKVKVIILFDHTEEEDAEMPLIGSPSRRRSTYR